MPGMHVYSTYEAKAKFSEVLRRVRSGQRVVIAYRGTDVAEIRPIQRRRGTLENAIEQLEQRGVLGRRGSSAPLRPLGRRRGALKRFLASRE